MAKQKTKSNIDKHATLHRVVLRNKDTRKPMHTNDFKTEKEAEELVQKYIASEKYVIVEYQFFDRDGACRTVAEYKL